MGLKLSRYALSRAQFMWGEKALLSRDSVRALSGHLDAFISTNSKGQCHKTERYK